MKAALEKYLKDLKQYGKKENIPNVTETGGRFLNRMVKIKQPKHLLEIGSANGYSTLWLAEAAQKIGAHIHSIDFSKPTFQEALRNIEQAGFSKTVTLHFGNALEVVPTIAEPSHFDFVFVDGEKRSYSDFWTLIRPRLTPDALVIFDDVLAFPEKTKSFLASIQNDPEVETLILPIDREDGVLIVNLP
ncbi:class I SAM-dependent methyltransferase [Candidatus Peregrinibacteria bacterium]|nr:MAG: class I SAM-dependent methyltransferase [Candidatus Peregrinibacteria bacterium]